MNIDRLLVDPTPELDTTLFTRPSKPSSLNGLVVGILDISKARGDVFLDRLAEHFDKNGVSIRRFRKPTVVRPAPLSLQQRIASECDLLVEGLAD